MSKSFLLEILTPEKVFYTGNVLYVSAESINGTVGVLADHARMVCALSVGQLHIKTEDGELIAFHSEGFMDVTKNYVLIMSQACEWPDEIDESRAKVAAQRASERIEHGECIDDIKHGKIALMRAMSRLQTRENAKKNMK